MSASFPENVKSFDIRVDGQGNIIYAQHVNDLQDEVTALETQAQRTMLLGHFATTKTLTGTETLTDASKPILYFDPGGANRDVKLAPEANTNHGTILVNTADADEKLVVKDDSGTTTIVEIGQGEARMVIPNGTAWKVLSGGEQNTDEISGLQLQWVSSTALTVGTGYAAISGGIKISVDAAIAKTGLSLSNSTWYHVYLFLNSGSPDIELSTTAPATPYLGIARAKTGDSSKRYIGSVRTDSSGNLFDFTHAPSSGYIAWITPVSANMRALSNGADTSWTQVSLANMIPVTASVSVIYALATGAVGMFLGTNTVEITSVGPGLRLVTTLPVPSQSIYYRLSATGSGAYLDILGYFFER